MIALTANGQVALYQQCGGENHNGATQCNAGLTCYMQDKWYSQCRPTGDCPPNWECYLEPGGSTTNPPTTSSSVVVTLPQSAGKFPNCQFRFGMGYRPDANTDYSAGDYITIWIGSPSTTHGTNFNPYWHGAMLDACVKNNKLPVYYGYIIAFMARDEWGLKDCDVGTPSLCERGSDYIRENRAKIVAKYGSYALETAKKIGKNAESVWLIEPDFWQYYGDTHQLNGPLSGTYMRAFFDDIVKAIKAELPNARISWDISAWLSESAMRTWWGFFASSTDIDYLHTSGGQSYPNSPTIKPNELRWSFLSALTGKRIIADTGYGVAGAGTGHIDAYDDVNNLKARITDGVIAVSQANFKNNWDPTLSVVRPQLPKFC